MKKIIALILCLLCCCSFFACGNTSENNDGESENPEISVIDFSAVSGYKTTLLNQEEAVLTNVDNTPLIITKTEETLEFAKKSNGGNTYDVYRYTIIGREEKTIGKEGDKDAEQVDVYKNVYTIVMKGDDLYFELYQIDYNNSYGDIIYPGTTHPMGKADSSEKTEIQGYVDKLSYTNNKVQNFITDLSISGLNESGTAKISSFVAKTYKTENDKYEAATDKNGVLFFARSVAKTERGLPKGQVFYPYSYVLSIENPSIDVDFTKVN